MRKPIAIVGSAVFFLVGPGVIVGLVPWLLTGWLLNQHWMFLRALGGILLDAGLAVLILAFVRFVVEGLGTPVPIAAPSRLVVGGVYRYVRNPMYVGAILAIIGQALIFGQLSLLVYAAVVFLVTSAFVHWYEEPGLALLFGADYEAYRKVVPGWWPRLHPIWRGRRTKS
jgi:protein-S-isoprenylcysteine O-methyltransferase Ste14